MRSSLLAQYLIYIRIYLSEGLAQVVIYEERNLESKNNLEDGGKKRADGGRSHRKEIRQSTSAQYNSL